MESNYKLIKINDFKVKKVGLGKQKKILHKDLFDFAYFSCAIFGPSGTGKTNIIYNILKYLAYCDDTKIIIVSTTIDADPLMGKLIKDFEKFNEVIIHDDLDSEIFQKVLADLVENEEDEKYIYAKSIVIFDDIDVENLRMKELYNMCKKCRHYKSHIFILSQYPIDITPGTRNQLRFLLLLAGWSPEIIAKIHKMYISKINLEEFQNLYDMATENRTGKEEDSHNFLYVGLKNGEYRKNLDEKFLKA